MVKCDGEILIFNLGFSVRTSEIGKGYATEIGTALAQYAFGALSANKIITFHADGNIASQKVIEKIGFKKEGIFRQHQLLTNGNIVDEHHYGLLNNDSQPELDVKWGK